MPDRRKIKILSVLMAEDLRVEASGAHTLVGVIAGRLVAATLPHMFLKLFFRIEFESDRTFSGSCHFYVRTPNGARMLEGTTQTNIRHDVRNIFGIGGGPVHFAEHGRYSIRFNVDQTNVEHEREVGYFDIASARQPVTGGARQGS